jgi:hypothetical protein
VAGWVRSAAVTRTGTKVPRAADGHGVDWRPAEDRHDDRHQHPQDDPHDDQHDDQQDDQQGAHAMQTTAPSTTGHDARDVLTEHGSAVEVQYLDGGEVNLRILAQPDRLDTEAGAELLARAVSHVRRRRTRVVRTAVDASMPAAGAILDALRSRVGDDVGEIALRRAGASVMVTLHLLPVRPGRRTTHAAVGRDARTVTPHATRPGPAARRAPHPQERSR